MGNGHMDSRRPATRLVHAGTQRSPFDETCEGLFMTSGYVHASAGGMKRGLEAAGDLPTNRRGI